MLKCPKFHMWGRPPHCYELPAPLRKREIAKLGDALDECEGLPDWRPESQDAEIQYQAALRDRRWHALRKFELTKTTPRRDDVARAGAEIADAEFEVRTAITARELLDAQAAFETALGRYEIAKRKYSASRRRAKADERAGIVRVDDRFSVRHK